MKDKNSSDEILSGDELVRILDALSNSRRIKIVAILVKERKYVSQLASELKMSRPLLYMHLKILEKAGLVRNKLEISSEGKAMNYFEIIPFDFHISNKLISEVANTISDKEKR